MEGINQWTLSVAACAVVVCIAEVLVTDTALEKQLRLLLGMILLCTVLLPLGDIIRQTSCAWPEGNITAGEVSGWFDGQQEKEICASLKALVENTLEQKDIHPASCHVTMDISEDGRIELIRAEVVLQKSDARRSSDVSRLLKEELGMECRTLIGST